MTTQLTNLTHRVTDQRLSRRTVVAGAALGGGLAAVGGLFKLPLVVDSALAQAGPTGILVIAASADVDTLDPHVSQLLVYGDMLRRPVFNTLVRYSDTLEYLPELAESWENPDDTTYVFHLREGVTYHDGTPVQASDVEFSFTRIAEKATVFSSRVANVAGYEVTDPQTITITLTEPQADFIDGLTLLAIISPAIAETVETAPVGSGPFRFVEWSPNDRIVLEAYPDYWEDGVPGVAGLEFRIIPEPQVALTNLQAGEVNGVLSLPVAQAAFLAEGGDVVGITVPTSSIHIFELLGKNSEPVRTDARVRQALAHALDKNAIQQTVFAGEGRPKWSFVPADSWAYKDVPGYEYDPAAAQALLAEAGVEGLTLTVLVPSGFPEGEQAATIWQAGLAEAGVTLNIELQELSVWLDNYINHTYDVIWNVFPGFADPNYFVALGLQPHFADGWTNPEAADIATQANQTLDQAERTALYGELQELFVADLPILVIQEAPQSSATAATVEGWQINPLGFVLLNTATVAE